MRLLAHAMDFIQPATWADALHAKAEHPDAVPIAGGTDVMVGLNFGGADQRGASGGGADQRGDSGGHQYKPMLDMSRVAELTEWSRQDGVIRLGAGVTYSRIIDELGADCPGLAAASRTVGSPQIRNRGTVAGNLGTASPAGDAHPPLLATGAVVEAVSVRGTRLIDIDDFFVHVKRNALAPDELIRAVRIPAAPGPQQFAKVGTRNAMVIAVCSVAVALDPVRRRVGTGIGSSAITPRRAAAAEAFAADRLPWDEGEAAEDLDDELAREFGRLVAGAADPIDDVRATAAYRRHSLAVLGRRTLRWAWADLTGGPR